MLAIIYNTNVWPCVINILNSNFISSTRHSVLLEQHAFVSKMLISRAGGSGGGDEDCCIRESGGARGSVIKAEFRAENMSFILQR